MNAEENSNTKSEAQAPNEVTELFQKKKRSSSSENGSPKRKKHKTEKHKKKKRESSSESVSPDSDSSLNTSSSCTKEKRKKRKKKKHKREKKKKVKREKEKRKRKKEKKRKKRQSKDEEIIGPVLPEDAVKTSPSVDTISQTTCRSMAPMTKEEWEKKQSIVRRVFDEETGRYRLIKGDGEVLEEIVSKERHREINRQATVGDGAFFQAKLATLQPK
ncbi:ADP-ribosylation factor-like protein 6-interacting protein 4 [Schistocerca piceifrons]|uniref:ADP-ribosylation factor-like protein 6-interacting protein 4 n=1 Tax=Schistocerca piceifrons TaxID=274613 RepID=UPI001F5F682E|nr:ADP-ribosylation factor-like protein 6-interacting protein 4 [Schistocerca piceifrons]